MDPTLIAALVVVFALAFDVANGWNDAANAVATVVGTRVLRPLAAVLMAAVLNAVGAFFSSEVARTVGKEVADPSLLGPAVFLAATVAAPVWITFCTFRALPISCSHSLLGGLFGAALVAAGPGAVHSEGARKILFGIVVSPLAGFACGWAIVMLVRLAFGRARPALVTRLFGRLQIFSAALMAFSHGTGDAQKAMGIITGALVAAGIVPLGPGGELRVPLLVRLACAVAMALGTAMGGWRVMKTLGMRLVHLRPYHGFAAETGAAATILANTLAGVPISTTHSITGAVLGVGAAQGVRAVRWGIGGKIVFAWVVTFPVCIVAGAALCWLLEALLAG